MDVSLKPKFVQFKHDENLDINSALFVFAQIVSEHVRSKNLSIYYFKKDNSCIFDAVKDLLKQKLSIELSIVFAEKEELFSVSLMTDRPHIIYIDDFLDDYVVKTAVINTIPPTSFLISREIKVEGIIEDYYCPLYVAGKGKNKLEMTQWRILDHWKEVEQRTRISIVKAKSEADLDNVRQALKKSALYQRVIVVAKYPDLLGLKEMIQEHREVMNQSYCFLISTNTEITDEEVKKRLKYNIAFSVLNNGIWGGEYYVPMNN